MGENQRPKLRLIRGGAGQTDSGDHANPYGMPRPSHLLPASGAPRKPVVQPGAQVSQKGRGDESTARPSGSKETYVEPDPTPAKGTVRPKRLRVIKGGKE